jgi:hypothetical protein
VLREVGRFTLLVENGNGEHILHKSGIRRMSPTR